MRRLLCIFGFMLGLIFSGALPVPADVPPPPVNQLIGIYDTRLTDPEEADCRVCHYSGVPDRHHLMVTTQNKACLDCHDLVADESCGCLVFAEFRDCLVCHTYIPYSYPSTPHHTTRDAQDRHCSSCHGSVVQDYDDDHYIPDYDISAVTPDPVCKTWDGPICVSGGCYVCHTADPSATPGIVAYSDLHHETRFDCAICHQPHGNIRNCESCHSPDSLHNIQADSDNPLNPGTIVPGGENLGWGHIGSGWDCFGCHESFGSSGFTASSVTPQTGATVPFIYSLSGNSVTAGNAVELVIHGRGFTNITDGVPFMPDVVIDNGSNVVTLTLVSITENRITATVPSTLTAGRYELKVVKDNKKSNKMILSVVPPVRITDVDCNKKMGILTITGSGFSGKSPATDQYINVQVNGVLANIIFWSDTLIKATVSACEGNALVTVNALMGSSSSGGGKPPRICKGKKC